MYTVHPWPLFLQLRRSKFQTSYHSFLPSDEHQKEHLAHSQALYASGCAAGLECTVFLKPIIHSLAQPIHPGLI